MVRYLHLRVVQAGIEHAAIRDDEAALVLDGAERGAEPRRGSGAAGRPQHDADAHVNPVGHHDRSRAADHIRVSVPAEVLYRRAPCGRGEGLTIYICREIIDMTTEASLWKAYAGFFPIGAAVSPTVIESHRNLLEWHFNSIVAENIMKPCFLQPQEGQYSFEAADGMVMFAKKNGMKVRGHTLVWHNQTPDWFFSGGD